MLAKLPLAHRHKVIRQALCQDRVALRDHLRHSFTRVLIHKAIVFVHLRISRLEVKVRGDIARESEHDETIRTRVLLVDLLEVCGVCV